MGKDSWDRTHLACTRFRKCTQDACGPRGPELMDNTRIFIGEKAGEDISVFDREAERIERTVVCAQI
jgi:hypothetical protein